MHGAHEGKGDRWIECIATEFDIGGKSLIDKRRMQEQCELHVSVAWVLAKLHRKLAGGKVDTKDATSDR